MAADIVRKTHLPQQGLKRMTKYKRRRPKASQKDTSTTTRIETFHKVIGSSEKKSQKDTSTTTRIETGYRCRSAFDTLRQKDTSTTTRIETGGERGRRRGWDVVRKTHLPQQGLKPHVQVLRLGTQPVRKTHLPQQGLKQAVISHIWRSVGVRKTHLPQQGLKLPLFRGAFLHSSASERHIYHNKD